MNTLLLGSQSPRLCWVKKLLTPDLVVVPSTSTPMIQGDKCHQRAQLMGFSVLTVLDRWEDSVTSLQCLLHGSLRQWYLRLLTCGLTHHHPSGPSVEDKGRSPIAPTPRLSGVKATRPSTRDHCMSTSQAIPPVRARAHSAGRCPVVTLSPSDGEPISSTR